MRPFIVCCVLLLGWNFKCVSGDVQTNLVQMLVPGFKVQELPLKISNINNLRFAPDGRLFALGYDGRVHILADSNGDELEDRDTLFWEKSTISVPVGMAIRKEGVYVSSHGKVSLLIDKDGDGKAETEEVIASGWPKTDVASGGVDATAVAFDTEGNFYFGLLTADYSNPYRVKDGISRYDLQGKRGTIQKFSLASKKMETIATGIRVPYALAFNRNGDLFVTDQEGETWCPGGNPLDELNHIIPGHNYGFPPRDDKYLTNIISDGPVVGFGPQHQSACGLFFNEERAGQRSFGPNQWEGDALVAGESRGKIWRVKLVKTPAGYIGKEFLIARLGMLTTDVAVSPKGELYVSCHGGKPDWGTGPKGEGKIFKITFSDNAAPQPVGIWPTSPMEIRVAFDRAIDVAITNRVGEMRIDYGEYVKPADRLEVLKPPYKTVGQQEQAFKSTVKVVSASLSPDLRTLILSTAPQASALNYALSLPGVCAKNSKSKGEAVDVAYDLHGIEASLSDVQGRPVWKGWLPHPDFEVSQALMQGSVEHEKFFKLARHAGELNLHSQIKLPKGNVTLQFTGNAPFEVQVGTRSAAAQKISARPYMAEVRVVSVEQWEPLVAKIKTQRGGQPEFHVSFVTEQDATIRPLRLDSLLLPWALPQQMSASIAQNKTDFSGGDYEKGRALFFGEQLKCAGCHRIRGEGGIIGPDLSNLVARDGTSILRDIREPSASINPDYVAYNVRLKSDDEFTGFVHAQNGDAIQLIAGDGKEKLLSRAEVQEMKVSTVSLMPTGLLDSLKENQVRDLMTFLLHEPPQRTKSDIEAVRKGLNLDTIKTNATRPLTIVLVASKQDHGPGQHDYPAWQKKWQKLLAEAPGVTAASAWQWPTDAQFEKADVLMFYYWNHDWSAKRLKQVDEFLARGGGIVLLHSAVIADKEPEQLAERIGLAAQSGRSKYLHAPVELKLVAGDNAITRGFKTVSFLDEPYWQLIGDTNKVTVLGTVAMEGTEYPLMWTFNKGKGRVFASILGHYTWTGDDPLFRTLILRGIAWSCGENEQRFEGLVNGQ